MEEGSKAKGCSLNLKTFLEYKVEDIIGYKAIEKNHSKLVNFVWCKVCAKYKKEILSSSTIKGSAKNSVLAFINGTNAVTKTQVSFVFYLYICFIKYFK